MGGGGGTSYYGSGGQSGNYGSTGAGGGASQGAKSQLGPYTRPLSYSPIAAKLAPEIDLIQTQTQFNETLERVKDAVKRVLEDNKELSEWYLNDHGFEHGKRVERNLELLTEVLDAAGLVDFHLHHPLTPEQLFVLKIAAYVHDLGRAVGVDTNHAQFAADYMARVRLPLSEPQRRLIIQLCLLHANGTTKNRYGNENLSELANKKIISREEAFLATLLRIADALDAGKARVNHNTQGTPRDEVIRRIKSEMPKNMASARLAHWEGHMAINKIFFTYENEKLGLEVWLDERFLTSYGANAAHRVRDTLRDVVSGLIEKHKITIKMKSQNLDSLKSWYGTFGDIFADDVDGMDVILGEEQ